MVATSFAFLSVACAVAHVSAFGTPPPALGVGRSALLVRPAASTPSQLKPSRRPFLQQKHQQQRSAHAAMMRLPGAAAAIASPLRMRAVLVRAAFACLASCLAVLLTVGRAYAAAARTRRAASSGLLSGDVIKYGCVGGLMLAGYVFQNKEDSATVRFIETPGAEREEPAAEVDDAMPRNQFETEAVMAAPAAEEGYMSSLAARMQQLQAEKAEEPDDEPFVDDSSDEWGTGSTAVLEPPKPGDEEMKPGLLDNGPAVEFPTGFPLVDGEVVEAEDAAPNVASEEQIAMLKRMMGGA